VEYSYRPTDPRAKLREVVARYAQSMRVAGRLPNAAVAFGGSESPAPPQTQGYLIQDRRTGRRYLLLEDGDVLHDPGEAWLDEPDDDLVTMLAKSLADARMGGSDWLVSTDGSEATMVPDRRTSQHPHGGVERRR
jgi:hypothetical protein